MFVCSFREAIKKCKRKYEKKHIKTKVLVVTVLMEHPRKTKTPPSPIYSSVYLPPHILPPHIHHFGGLFFFCKIIINYQAVVVDRIGLSAFTRKLYHQWNINWSCCCFSVGVPEVSTNVKPLEQVYQQEWRKGKKKFDLTGNSPWAHHHVVCGEMIRIPFATPTKSKHVHLLTYTCTTCTQKWMGWSQVYKTAHVSADYLK